MRTPRPRVLIADDYTDLLVAFKRLLAPSCEVVGCVADGDALFESLARLQPDVIVVDLSFRQAPASRFVATSSRWRQQRELSL